jgi:hypothetical protein
MVTSEVEWTASGGDMGWQRIMQLLRFDEIKEIQVKVETDIRLKCIELALAGAPGSVERAIDTAQAYFDFIMDRSPSAPERMKQSSSNTHHS